jgi:SanA protein
VWRRARPQGGTDAEDCCHVSGSPLHSAAFALEAVAAGLIVAMAGAKIVLSRAAKGKTYSDIASIPHRHVGLVLGCATRLANGRPNLFFRNRVEAAANLYLAGKLDYLLVSGDDEAEDMKDALVQSGVPPERIYCDYAGLRTLDSVIRAKEVFGQSQITIVSQKFHNQRAIFIAKHRGLDAIGLNAPDLNACDSLKVHLREHFARVVCVMDVLVRRPPKVLGEKMPIPGS